MLKLTRMILRDDDLILLRITFKISFNERPKKNFKTILFLYLIANGPNAKIDYHSQDYILFLILIQWRR